MREENITSFRDAQLWVALACPLARPEHEIKPRSPRSLGAKHHRRRGYFAVAYMLVGFAVFKQIAPLAEPRTERGMHLNSERRL